MDWIIIDKIVLLIFLIYFGYIAAVDFKNKRVSMTDNLITLLFLIIITKFQIFSIVIIAFYLIVEFFVKEKNFFKFGLIDLSTFLIIFYLFMKNMLNLLTKDIPILIIFCVMNMIIMVILKIVSKFLKDKEFPFLFVNLALYLLNIIFIQLF